MPQPGVENVTCGSKVSGCSGWSKIRGSVDVSRHAAGRVTKYAMVMPDRMMTTAMTATMRRTVLGFRPPNDGLGPTGGPAVGWGAVAKGMPPPREETGDRI